MIHRLRHDFPHRGGHAVTALLLAVGLVMLMTMLVYCWYHRRKWIPLWSVIVAIPVLILFNMLGHNRDILKQSFAGESVQIVEQDAGMTRSDKLKKQLDTQGNTLNDEARENLAKQLDQKKKNLQRKYEDAQNDFETQKNEILKNLFNKVYTTLDKYAKDNGYGVIMDVSTSQTVLWAAQPTNITKAIVDAYNVASGVPAPPAAAAPKPASATAPSTTRPSTTSH